MKPFVYIVLALKIYSASGLYAINVDETYRRSLILQDLQNQTVLIDCSDTRDGSILLRREGSKCPGKDFFVNLQIKYGISCGGAMRFYLNIRSLQFNKHEKVRLLGSLFDEWSGQTLSGIVVPKHSSPLSVAQFFTARDSLRIEYSGSGDCDPEWSELLADFAIIQIDEEAKGKEIECPALQGFLPRGVSCSAAKQMRIVCPQRYYGSRLADNPATAYLSSEGCTDESTETDAPDITDLPDSGAIKLSVPPPEHPNILKQSGQATTDVPNFVPKFEDAMYPFPSSWTPGPIDYHDKNDPRLYYPWKPTTPQPTSQSVSETDQSDSLGAPSHSDKRERTDKPDTTDIPDTSDVPDKPDELGQVPPGNLEDTILYENAMYPFPYPWTPSPYDPNSPFSNKPSTTGETKVQKIVASLGAPSHSKEREKTDKPDTTDIPDIPDIPDKPDDLGEVPPATLKEKIVYENAMYPFPYPWTLSPYHPNTDVPPLHSSWRWSTIFPEHSHHYTFSRWIIIAGVGGMAIVSAVLIYAVCKLCCGRRNTVHYERTTVVTQNGGNAAYGTFEPAQSYAPGHGGKYSPYAEPLIRTYGGPAPPYAPMEAKPRGAPHAFA